MSTREHMANQDTYWGMAFAPEPTRETPEWLAHEARGRGDVMFQIDLPLTNVQGYSQLGQSATRTVRIDQGDVLGRIEAQGWKLEMFSTSYIQTGASTSPQIGIGPNVEAANHGYLVGVYVFRRV